jgi:2-oxoisovalerate dehydrogenase E2 component (dihydrolipoyl transacylase)
MQLNAKWEPTRVHLTLLSILACLIVLAVRDWPQVHACFHDQARVLTLFGAVHLGMTTRTSRPVPMVSVGFLVLQEHLERL